jgi:hypothetical protein
MGSAYEDYHLARTEGATSHSVIPCRLRATIAWNLLGIANGCLFCIAQRARRAQRRMGRLSTASCQVGVVKIVVNRPWSNRPYIVTSDVIFQLCDVSFGSRGDAEGAE